MPRDYFASDTLHLVLTWVAGVPALLAVLSLTFDLFKRQEGSPWLLTAWTGLCFILFSPMRYALFLLVAAAGYPFQSWSAFWSSWLLGILVPIPFMLLVMVGIILPYMGVMWIARVERWAKWARYALAALLSPLAALLGSICFVLLLPYGSLVTHWLRAEDVIRATNGPAYYVFSWFGSSRAVVSLPKYIDKTPGGSQDLLRCHVASTYLSDDEHVRFVRLSYPAIYDEMARQARGEYEHENGR